MLRIFLLTTIVLAMSMPATASESVIEEIVVTAQKREQSIQDIGISVSAMTGDTIRELGLKHTSDLVAQMPNVSMYDAYSGGGQPVNIGIRGVSLNDFNDGTEAPSVVYIDGFYVLPLAGASQAMFDMERVEVLRGPQGTLFGRNATGGLVHFITRDPSDDLEGYVEASAGERGLFNLEGALNIPVTDQLLTRFSFVKNDDDGYVDNVTRGGDGDNTDWWAVRGQLLFQPSDTLDFLLKVQHGEAKNNGSYQGIPIIGTAAGLQREVGGNEDPFGTCLGCDALGFRERLVGAGDTDNSKNSSNTAHNLLGTEQTLAIGEINWDIGGVTLTSISGFLALERDATEDCDATPFDSCATRYQFDTEEWTQEIRLAGDTDEMHWTTGFYYLHQNADAAQDAQLDSDGALSGGVPGFGFGGPYISDVDWEKIIDAWAVFGQVEYNLNPQLTLIAGLRYSEDEVEFEQAIRRFVAIPGSNRGPNSNFDQIFPNPGVFLDIPGLAGLNFTKNTPLAVDDDFDGVADRMLSPAGGLTEQSYEDFNAKLELDWRPNDDWLMYASFSRGTKAGGFNNGFIAGVADGITNADVPFDKEVLHAYEIGFKSTLWEGRAQLNGAAFYYDYADFHAFSFVGLGGTTINADATIAGAEFELLVMPVAGLDIQLGVSFLPEATVEDITNPLPSGALRIADRDMVLAPEVTVNALLRYSWPVFGGTVTLQGDVYYTDEYFSNLLNDPVALVDSRVEANARVSWRSSSERWELALWGRNLTDERYNPWKFPVITTAIAPVNRPRWFGGSASYRF